MDSSGSRSFVLLEYFEVITSVGLVHHNRFQSYVVATDPIILAIYPWLALSSLAKEWFLSRGLFA